MEQKTRLLSILKGQPADRPPFICPGGMMNMAVTELMEATECGWPEAHVDSTKMAQLTLAANRLAGIENVGVPFCMTVEAEAMGARIDLGSRWSEPNVAVYPMDTVADIDRLSQIDVTAGRAGVCVNAVRILRKEAPQTPVFANLTGPVSLATSLVDPLIFYRALIKNKEGAHKLMSIANQTLVLFGSALIEAGADPRLPNRHGSTPLHLAVQPTGRGGAGSLQAREQQRGIVRFLMERGAKPTDADGLGKSVYQAATSAQIRALLTDPTAG